MAATIDVNVANQAYPPPPPGSQGLPVPSSVGVESLPFIQPSFSQGTALPQAPTINVQNQSAVLSPATAQDFVVTENGNFATNNQSADVQTFKVQSVLVQGPEPSDSTTVYQISLTDQNGNPIKLSSYGVDFTQLFANFPAAAAASSPENIPSRPITAFNDPNTIVVPVQDSFGNKLYPDPTSNIPPYTPGTVPAVGDLITIGIVRQGASLTVNSNFNEIDVTIAPPPPVALTTPAVGNLSLGNVFPPPIGTPFVGSGQGAPPFIGTFEVENQALIGKGLPVNVFV